MIMNYINQNVVTLTHYLKLIEGGAKALRPPRCINCGKRSVWCHGTYVRKVHEKSLGIESLKPVNVPIFRYLCSFCKHTFSVLPKFISPRRWYVWAVQQAALLLIISGCSSTYTAKQLNLVINTCRRWIKNLKHKLLLHAFHLRSRFPELGRNDGSFIAFWSACLKQMSLAKAMYFIHRDGGAILQ
jgi:transposase